MRRVEGRSIYIVDGTGVSAWDDTEGFARRCSAAHIRAIWLRLARGEQKDANFSNRERIADLKNALAAKQIELWGWHVPFCSDHSAAQREATDVSDWVDKFDLDGVLIDAERTKEPPRFRGGSTEAETYCQILSQKLKLGDRGLALSSHDQPHLHNNLPFSAFLKHVLDYCPQVYFNSLEVNKRLDRSIKDYKTLDPQDFLDRFKPTGNMTIRGDVALPSTDICRKAIKIFVDRVKAEGFKAHSFWCLDEAPPDILDFLSDIPS